MNEYDTKCLKVYLAPSKRDVSVNYSTHSVISSVLAIMEPFKEHLWRKRQISSSRQLIPMYWARLLSNESVKPKRQKKGSWRYSASPLPHWFTMTGMLFRFNYWLLVIILTYYYWLDYYYCSYIRWMQRFLKWQPVSTNASKTLHLKLKGWALYLYMTYYKKPVCYSALFLQEFEILSPNTTQMYFFYLLSCLLQGNRTDCFNLRYI